MQRTRNTALFLLILLQSCLAAAQGNSLADTYFQAGNEYRVKMKADSALFFYEKAAGEYRNEDNILGYVNANNQAGILLTRQDRYEEALHYLGLALSSGLASLDSNSLALAMTYISLGVVYNAQQKFEKALQYHYKALSIRLLRLGESHADVATSYGNIGNVLRNGKDYQGSIEAHSKAMQIRERLFGPDSPEIIESFVGLGHAYREKKEYAASLDYFNRALQNKILQRGAGHKDLSRFYGFLADVYFLMGDSVKGAAYKKESGKLIKE